MWLMEVGVKWGFIFRGNWVWLYLGVRWRVLGGKWWIGGGKLKVGVLGGVLIEGLSCMGGFWWLRDRLGLKGGWL